MAKSKLWQGTQFKKGSPKARRKRTDTLERQIKKLKCEIRCHWLVNSQEDPEYVEPFLGITYPEHLRRMEAKLAALEKQLEESK